MNTPPTGSLRASPVLRSLIRAHSVRFLPLLLSLPISSTIVLRSTSTFSLANSRSWSTFCAWEPSRRGGAGGGSRARLRAGRGEDAPPPAPRAPPADHRQLLAIEEGPVADGAV